LNQLLRKEDKEAVVAYLKASILLERSKTRKLHSGWPASGPRIFHRTSWIPSRSASSYTNVDVEKTALSTRVSTP
jgi:hypothetical protein